MTELATFGAGCFWGVEDIFRALPGVTDTKVGYAGGTLKNPTYEDVCSDKTGHAEVVQVTFDPEKISYEKLLDVFFSSHNPTQMNAQGPDVGSQYRSVIFTQSDAQAEAAKKALETEAKSGKWKRPVVTQIEAAKPFYKAEEYHQNYLEKHGLSSCHL